jgi:hypothetical protein
LAAERPTLTRGGLVLAPSVGLTHGLHYAYNAVAAVLQAALISVAFHDSVGEIVGTPSRWRWPWSPSAACSPAAGRSPPASATGRDRRPWHTGPMTWSLLM